jgi:hypothetical protein
VLYDPKWKNPTTTKPPKAPTVADFAAWLETMPADKEYVWGRPSVCALTLYLEARGFKAAGSYWYIAQELCMEREAMKKPRTFGGLLNRVRAALS